MSKVRIYDKAKQQKQPGHWWRVEYEFRDDDAQDVVTQWIQDGPAAVAEAMGGCLTFRIPGANRQRSRWEVAPWWAAILGTVATRRISHSRTRRQSLDSLKARAMKQYAPDLAAIVQADGGCVDFLYEMIGAGTRRFKSKHLGIIQSAIDEQDAA